MSLSLSFFFLLLSNLLKNLALLSPPIIFPSQQNVWELHPLPSLLPNSATPKFCICKYDFAICSNKSFLGWMCIKPVPDKTWINIWKYSPSALLLQFFHLQVRLILSSFKIMFWAMAVIYITIITDYSLRLEFLDILFLLWKWLMLLALCRPNKQTFLSQVCDSYPTEVYVPKSATAHIIVGSSKFRSRRRFPALSYYCKGNNVSVNL